MSAAVSRARRSAEADWRSQAACGDHTPDLFFPSEDAPVELVRVQEATAKAICRFCPVAGACLSTALTQRMFYGVWGGLSAEDRKAVLASRSGIQPMSSTCRTVDPAKRTRVHRRAAARCTAQATTVAVAQPPQVSPVGVSA